MNNGEQLAADLATRASSLQHRIDRLEANLALLAHLVSATAYNLELPATARLAENIANHPGLEHGDR